MQQQQILLEKQKEIQDNVKTLFIKANNNIQTIKIIVREKAVD